MIELDKRIISGKKPLTAFDEIDSKFIGKDCYFSDYAGDYGDLSNCQKGCLLSINGKIGFNATKNNSYASFNYCLPCEWVEEPKKKYRPFTGIEFAEKFDCMLGKVIRLREKRPEYSLTEYEYKTVFTGYRWCGDVFEVFLNSNWINLSTLLEKYEHYENSEWCKFGVEVEE